MTTAIYPNRQEDKRALEARLGLQETGDEVTYFYHEGYLIAKGYTRIVYGDHGPYIEFHDRHIVCHLVDKYGRFPPDPLKLPPETEANFYYYWLHPQGTNLKVYLQIKPVTNLPNAPARADGKPHRFNRKEGYADYRRGFYYINPYSLTTNISELQ